MIGCNNRHRKCMNSHLMCNDYVVPKDANAVVVTIKNKCTTTVYRLLLRWIQLHYTNLAVKRLSTLSEITTSMKEWVTAVCSRCLRLLLFLDWGSSGDRDERWEWVGRVGYCGGEVGGSWEKMDTKLGKFVVVFVQIFMINKQIDLKNPCL